MSVTGTTYPNTTYSYGTINRMDELMTRKEKLIAIGNWYYTEIEEDLNNKLLDKYLKQYNTVLKEIEDLIILRSR